MSDDALSSEQFTPAKLPTHAILGTIGKVRIKSYDRNGYFHVVDNRDNKRYVHRDRLTFIK